MAQPTLQQEVILLRSAVAGLVGKDKEGQYQPKFVTDMYKALDREATHTFESPDQFLKDIERT